MKLRLLLIPLLALPWPLPAADVEVKLQQLKDIGMLPEEKLGFRPEDRLDPKRSNPFAERAKAKETKTVETIETEEIKIRRVFDTLKVTGLTKYNGKYSALLGDIILEEGSQVKPVIPEQTQILRVTRVTDKFVEILWVEGAGFEAVTPRRIVKRVELSPRVGVLLAAQPPGTSDPNAMTYLDQNGKVIWPKKMAPQLEGMLDSLPNTGTATLSNEEEAALMDTPGDPEPAPQLPEMESSPFAPGFSGPGEGVNPAAGIEDPVQPVPPEGSSPPDDDDAPPATGS